MNKLIKAFKNRGLLGMISLTWGYARWYWCKTLQKNRLFIRKFANYKMYVSLDDPGISTTLGRGGAREIAYTQILKEVVKPGHVVLDVGANLGYYALMQAAIVGEQGFVYAVEPVPTNFAILQKNVAFNHFEDRMETFQMAVSDKKGTMPLFLSKASNLNTLFRENAEDKQDLTGECVEVQVTDIPSFLNGKKPIQFIRMDIEGAEVGVLAGVIQLLDQQSISPDVLFETHRSKYNETDRNMKQVLGELFQRGYYVKKIISNNDDGTKWLARGLTLDDLVSTDGTQRGIYSNVDNKTAIELICEEGGVRAALLSYSPEKKSVTEQKQESQKQSV